MIRIDGDAVESPTSIPVSDLAQLPRREISADFHCVAGWSATDLRWAGVPFADFYREVIQPALRSDVAVKYVVAEGLDHYRSIVLLDDALGDDVMIADELNGSRLGSDHGAPARFVSPSQYGFVNTKHLCRIELYTHRPRVPFHDNARIQLGLLLLQPHQRARVWQEERHRYIPARMLRALYWRLVPLFKAGDGNSR
jgi:DMSO/TMAO reductase YedYZ molybdopterin-dependent catalytic subunit